MAVTLSLDQRSLTELIRVALLQSRILYLPLAFILIPNFPPYLLFLLKGLSLFFIDCFVTRLICITNSSCLLLYISGHMRLNILFSGVASHIIFDNLFIPALIVIELCGSLAIKRILRVWIEKQLW